MLFGHISLRAGKSIITAGINIVKWISVKDRLPETESEERLLAFGRASCGTCSPSLQIQFCIYTEKNGFEFGEYDCSFAASYWMPLPELPDTT